MAYFPVGKHMARVTSSEMGTSSNGTVQIAIGFEDDEGHFGTWYGFFTDAALNQCRRAICALGIEWHAKDDATVDIESMIGPDSVLIGREASITVEMDEDREGNPRPRVRWVNKPGGGGLRDPMDATNVQSFAQSFREKAAGRGERTASSDVAGDYALDDIPFDHGFEAV